MNTFALALVALVGGALAIAPCAQADEWTRQWTFGDAPDLHVTASDATVFIEASSGNRVEAVLKTRGISIGDSGVRVVDHQDGNRLDLDIREPSSHFGSGMKSIELRLRVPQKLLADVHTGDGSIRLRGLQGKMRMYTGDGSIEAEDLDGSLEARSGDGSLRIQGRFDNVQVRTGDGGVELRAVEGSQVRSDWSVETGDGSIRMNIPRNLAADVQARTGDGSIQLDVPITTDGIRNNRAIQGKLNGGGPLLALHSGDGSIRLGVI